uniref:Uncharacterized protein n=1 Tax=Strongyloides papillosus TaxID=174720 RepID=A0A0N5BVE6_STREA
MESLIRLMKLMGFSIFKNKPEINIIIFATDPKYFGNFKLGNFSYDETIGYILKELCEEFCYSIVQKKISNVRTSTPISSTLGSIFDISMCV